MNEEQFVSDVTVIGGGLAGVSAAIAAARNGRSVALVTNRPVLGGNSSSEVRVWVVGATAHGYNHNAREGGIMGELFVENQYRNPDGNPYLWDALIYEKVRAEENLTLFLNTDVRIVDASGPDDDRTITSVTGWMMGSERLIEFSGPIFVDATGDGLVGFLAGADHRIGREARSEYGEPWAPEVADDVTLGSTLLFYTTDAGHPVKFVPPAFAKDLSTTSIPHNRIISAGDNGCAYWWIEFGGELDTVRDNEAIRDELWSVIYGIWDHIKNSGQFDADRMTLEWVGSLPGKREYRRLLGDYVLTQNDIIEQRFFSDQVAFGGWSIDLHPPGGMYASEEGAKQRYADGIYPIPYRSLYSRNVRNMLMAGRNVSASHVAFGSTRVMATCATIGQAVGTAAALAVASGLRPSELDATELQQNLLRDDGSIFGIAEEPGTSIASRASVTASSSLARLEVRGTGERWPLIKDAAIVFPVEDVLSGLALQLSAAAPTELRFTLSTPSHDQNYVPGEVVAQGTVTVGAGHGQWIAIDPDWQPDGATNVFLQLHAEPEISLDLGAERPPGTFSLTRKELLPKHERPQPLREWSDRPFLRRSFRFRVDSEAPFQPGKAVNGLLRPFAGPNMWASADFAEDAEPWIALRWADEERISVVDLVFDDDVNEDLINLHHHRTPFEVMPSLVRDYRLEAEAAGVWTVVAEGRDNRVRRVRHVFREAFRATALRLVIESSNGEPRAHLQAFRVYA
ncbi:FAD-dependent oxidoreductase [Luethyella okanaganae]|uniref:FAD-dependent oxidoreductase n=1 Tax=Luethyella okanaganae TaxID=69372 RepID=A0ABW1VEV7_9MICO